MGTFVEAMRECGIEPPDILIGDSVLHRFHIAGDRPGSKNGAYVFDAMGGWFMSHKTGVSGVWKPKGAYITGAMKIHIDALKKANEKARLEKAKEVERKAAWIWNQAAKIEGQHQNSYLEKKGIKSHSARIYKDALVIPLMGGGKIKNLQFISPDGTKRFMSGGVKKSCWYRIGEVTGKVLVCEGYATGASLHENTGHCVFVAFDAGNLVSVAIAVRGMHPDVAIIIAGDNDATGIAEARKAAAACGGVYCAPKTPGHDWNDYYSEKNRGTNDRIEAIPGKVD